MFITDMHCDSLSRLSGERGLINGYNTSKVHPFLQFFASYTPFLGRSAQERRAITISHMNAYLYETERLGLKRISTVRELTSAEDLGAPSAMFTIEGGGGLLADSEELFTLHKLGLRVMGLTWDTNELGSGAMDDEDNGLTSEGVRMLNRFSELGITPDVSHLSDNSFYDLCEVFSLPFIASHSNFRAICNHKRNLTDDMARELTARGGVIGINLYPDFLSEGDASIDDVIRHIDYGMEKFGENSIAFGFDIDGTSGKYPKGLSEEESIHDKVMESLARRYSNSTLEKLAGANVINFLKGVLD
jgi:membrane dipeptidase